MLRGSHPLRAPPPSWHTPCCVGAPRNAQPTPRFPSHFELKTFDAYSYYVTTTCYCSTLVLDAVAVISNVARFAPLRYDTFILTIGKHQNDYDHARRAPAR